ncbi:MAG TPA: hypothetical protein VGM84_15030 [Steroidobacteraceae bacterium]|jgi:hypothetical protein
MARDWNVIQEAEQAGLDIALIDANLRLTYEQRVMRHEALLNLICELERTGRLRRGEADPFPEANQVR